MSAAETTQEPTMEEILASIRRIISEEDQPAVAAAPPPPLDDILDLPAPMPEPVVPEADPLATMTEIDDLDMIDVLESEPAPVPPPVVRPAPITFNTSDIEDGLIGEPAMNEALGAFGRLAAHMPLSENPNQTLEGVVQDMLRPMLKQWLDANLPRIVEEKVEAEILRMSRVVRRAK